MTRSEASRINGAKSHGPVTPEGRARSAQNNYRHGLYAKSAGILCNEDREAYCLTLREYVQSFQPRSTIEAEWIVTMVNATFRMRRAERDMLNIIDMEQYNPINGWDELFGTHIDHEQRQTLGYTAALVNRGKTMHHLEQAVAACTRIIARATAQLSKSRKAVDPSHLRPVEEILQDVDFSNETGLNLPEGYEPDPPPTIPEPEHPTVEPEPPAAATEKTENTRFEPKPTSILGRVFPLQHPAHLPQNPPTTPNPTPKGGNHPTQQ